MSTITQSGIFDIGKIAWGSHFCHLYADKTDLVHVLVPYFLAGLLNHERCIWITAQPYGVAQATADLGQALPELGQMKSRGQITICGFEEWYLRPELSKETTIQRWLTEEERALQDGYNGLRISGNTSFVDGRAWSAFMDYERRINDGLQGRRVIALCSYDASKFRNSHDADVAENHHFRISRNRESWEIFD